MTQWHKEGTIIYKLQQSSQIPSYSQPPSQPPTQPPSPHKICAIDLMGTLIQSDKSDYVCRYIDDWIWVFESAPGILNWFHLQGYRLVIFSNHKGNKDLDTVMARIDDVLNDLCLSVDVFVSHHKSTDKPGIAMWQLYTRLTNLNQFHPDSLMIGDNMLGYSTNPCYSNSDIDYGFAVTIGLKPYTPDQVFTPNPLPPLNTVQELIIAVGQQGAGKSTFANTYLKQTHVILESCKPISKVEKALKQGQSVYIDATNPKRQDRAQLINLAQSMGISVRIFWFARSGHLSNKARANPVPEVALRGYTAKLEIPEVDDCPVIRIN